MRYIVTDEQPVTLPDVRQALEATGAGYRFEEGPAEITIEHGEYPVAQVTLNVPGDGLFDEEREELLESAEDGRGRGKRKVLDTLRAARQIVAIQVLTGARDMESTLALIDPLWDWLVADRAGLGQADGQG